MIAILATFPLAFCLTTWVFSQWWTLSFFTLGFSIELAAGVVQYEEPCSRRAKALQPGIAKRIQKYDEMSRKLQIALRADLQRVPVLRERLTALGLEINNALAIVKIPDRQLVISRTMPRIRSKNRFGFDSPVRWTTQRDRFALAISVWTLVLLAWIPVLLCWRSMGRRTSGHCEGCGFDLRGNTLGRCPECGMAVRPHVAGCAPGGEVDTAADAATCK